MENKTIPTEVAAAILMDRQRNRQLVDVTIALQECMAGLIGELHRSGVIDSRNVMQHLLAAHQSGEAGHSGNEVLEVLIGRIARLSSTDHAEAERLLASLTVSDSCQSP